MCDYLPSDHSTLQVIYLDKFTKAAGIVVVGCFGIAKGLSEIRKDGNTQLISAYQVKKRARALLKNLKALLNVYPLGT